MSDPGSLIFTVLVFATVFAVVAAVGLRFLASAATDRGNASPRSTPGTHQTSMRARTTVRTILRIVSAIFLAYLVTITVASYFEASPHDGTYLITGVLVILTVMATGYLHNMDQRLRTTEGDVTLRDNLLRTVEADVAAKIGSALLDGTNVEWSVAAPEVHSIDLETLARGQSMLAEGKSLDEVCRAIAPEYGSWVAGHQQAYQSIVRAALEHGA